MDDLELNPLLQGVHFTLPMGQGAVRVFVAADVLMERFGAGQTATEWLKCARVRSPTLTAIALKMQEQTGQATLVITSTTWPADRPHTDA